MDLDLPPLTLVKTWELFRRTRRRVTVVQTRYASQLKMTAPQVFQQPA